ncbi:MAG: T9SS type A sorting domain-containing protein [Bacteroidetes bacterium]|nr:T9SS type A sorting domain-containing protein [Bacteroidota bacterium]
MAQFHARLAGIILFFSLSLSISKAQYVYIPDPAFRNFLISDGYAPAFNGDSLDTTSTLVTSAQYIRCRGWGIQSLEGIQYFSGIEDLDCSVNYLTELPPLPSTLLYLMCSKNLLNSLPALPVTMYSLYCDHNPLYVLPTLPANLIHLVCSNNELISLPALPPNLNMLICDSNYIQFLPPLDSNLQTLICNYNLLDTLPPLPSSLDALLIKKNNLSSMPILPDSLYSLDVSDNSIGDIDSLPPGLQNFSCNMIGMYHICPLPDSLRTFSCRINSLTVLPSLPQTLIYLEIGYNAIDSLPASLPPNISYLSFDGNPISVMPLLPATIRQLMCGTTKIRTIPPLPPNLDLLYCSQDSLTSLPPLPASLHNLAVNLNFLQDLPALPDSLYYFFIDHNPLQCVPHFSYAEKFSWSNTNISCFPNIIHSAHPDPAIDTVPLCQPSSGCPTYWNISGNIYHDLNSDCLKDTNEQELKNIPVLLDSAGTLQQICYTNANGDYSFRTGLGNYRVRINPTNLPIPYLCPATGSYTSQLTPIDSMDANRDFALTCPNAFDLYAGSVSPEQLFRPTRLVKVNINAGDLLGHFGTACFTDTGFVQCNFTGPISYVGPAVGALTPTVVSPGSLRWNVNDFSVIDPSTSFNIEVRVDSFAMINDPICFNLSIYPFIGDIFPLDNYTSACYPVRVAVDPNEKYMYPSGSVDTSDRVFNFTVFFQNTGNAPAEDIYIIDTLDSDLDASTFEFLSSTHDVVTQMLPGNILRFNFHGINLIDSVTNESLSHGNVQFRIHRKVSTGMGTEITNTAYIYFDQNAPVATNEVYAIVTSLVGIPVVDLSEKLLIYPNPAQGMIRIANKTTGKAKVEVTGLAGNLIASFTSFSDEIVFDTSALNAGVYVVSVTDMNGRRVGRFVKH